MFVIFGLKTAKNTVQAKRTYFMRLKYPLKFVGEPSVRGRKNDNENAKNKGFQSLENPYSFMANNANFNRNSARGAF